MADGRGSRLDLLQVDGAPRLQRKRRVHVEEEGVVGELSPRTFSNIASRSGTSRPLRCSPETSSTTWPWCSITVRSPTSSAWRMLWVTIMVVSFFGDDPCGEMQDEVGGARVERRGVFVEQQDTTAAAPPSAG